MKWGQMLRGGLGCLLGIMILFFPAHLILSHAAEPDITAPADGTASQNAATLHQIRSAIETRGARWVASVPVTGIWDTGSSGRSMPEVLNQSWSGSG